MTNNRAIILHWAENNNIETGNVDSAIKIANAQPDKAGWSSFLNQLLIWLGIIALSSGVIFFFFFFFFFFCRFIKFAFFESAMLVSAISYFYFAAQQHIKTAILFGMALLTGALLALVWVTYQTGADPWQFFAVWCVLILPWVFISRASSLWLLWSGLLNLSIFLYLDTHRGILGFMFREEQYFWIFASINTVLLIGFEFLSWIENRDGHSLSTISVQNRYAAQVIAIVAGFFVTWIACIGIFDSRSYNGWGKLVYVVWIAVAFKLYRYHYKDLLILSAGTLSGIIVVMAFLIKALGRSLVDWGFLVLTIAIIALSSFAAIWLKKLSKEFSIDSKLKMEEQ